MGLFRRPQVTIHLLPRQDSEGFRILGNVQTDMLSELILSLAIQQCLLEVSCHRLRVNDSQTKVVQNRIAVDRIWPESQNVIKIGKSERHVRLP